MSLINDALKRARDAQPQNPLSGAPSLPPVEPPQRDGPGWMLPVAFILALLVIACIFMGVALMKRPAQPVVAKTVETPSPAPPPAQPAPSPTVAPAPAPTPVPVLAPPPVATNSPPATNAAPPKLKLQGIISLDPKHPTAIVNGKSVSVGDSIGGFRVKAISSSSIEFQRPDGSQQTLKVGE
jgi:hypothetical protein